VNGAQALIRTLVDGGVDVCFGNPGTSEMHFVAALDREPKMRGVLCLFEGVAAKVDVECESLFNRGRTVAAISDRHRVGSDPTCQVITAVDDDVSELQFRHHGLTAELDCIEMCTRGWDHYIESLRRYVEVGQGNPRGSDADRARRAEGAQNYS